MDVKSPLAVVNFVPASLLLVMVHVSAANPVCAPGYTGNNCSIDIDDCATANCSGQGRCSDHVNGYFCFCFTGFYGLNCEIDAGPCDPNPCNNGGSCSLDGGLIICNCASGYEGERCDSAKLARNFTVTLTMLDRRHNSDYEDLTNFLTRGLIKDLTDIFEPFFRGNLPGLLGITFSEFTAGKVGLGVTFDISFEGASAVNESSIMQALQRGNGTNQLRFEFVDLITVTEKQSIVAAPVSALTGDDSSEIRDWVLALIIAGVILFVLLVIIITLAVLLHRKENSYRKELVVQFSGWNLRSFSGKNGT